jgi:hypothetical protein
MNKEWEGAFPAPERTYIDDMKDAMVQHVSRAISRGEIVKLTCNGETLGFFAPQGFIGPDHPMFDKIKKHKRDRKEYMREYMRERRGGLKRKTKP